MTLLELARSGDLGALTERLDEITQGNFRRKGGGSLTDREQLLIEARDYARLGDLDEVTFRLRLYAEPKFSDVVECQMRYDQVMAARKVRP